MAESRAAEVVIPCRIKMIRRVTKHRLHQMAHTLGTTTLHNLGRVWMVDVNVTVSGSF
jgi:hypothetical protein